MTQTFFAVTSTALPDSVQFRYYIRRLPVQKKTFQNIQVLSVIKEFRERLSHSYTFICFQSLGIKYLHDISFVNVGREKDMFKYMRQDFANNWKLVIVLGFDLYISFSLFEYVLIDGVVK